MMLRLLLLAAGCLASSAAVAGEQPDSGWVRFDLEGTAPNLMGGVTLPVGAGPTAVAIDASVGLRQGAAYVGFTREAGSLYLMPQLGVQLDWDAGEVGVGPSLIAAFEVPPLPVYLESWTRVMAISNTVYERIFVLIRMPGGTAAVGPQLEWFEDLDDADRRSLKLGARVNGRLDDHTAFGLFLGAELRKAAQEPLFGDAGVGVVTRLTVTGRIIGKHRP